MLYKIYLKMKLKWCIIFLILIVVVITSLAVLVGYIVKREFHEYNMHYKSSISHFSLKCETLLVHPDDDNELFDKNKDTWKWSVNEHGENICKTNSVKDIVEKIVDNTSRRRLAAGLDQRDHYLSCGNRSLAPKSGDLTAMFRKISHQNVNDNGFHMKVNWDTHPSNSFIDPQFSYHDGEIIIPEGRTYFVYASFLFNLTNADRNSYNGLYKVSLRICKKIYGYERTLLGKTEVYNSSVGGIITSLNVVGNFLLQKDDVLFVRVSKNQVLSFDSKGNSFGLFPS